MIPEIDESTKEKLIRELARELEATIKFYPLSRRDTDKYYKKLLNRLNGYLNKKR